MTSIKVYIVTNVEPFFCIGCSKLSYSEIKKLNSVEKAFICHECRTDYSCLVCQKLCNDGCIMCNKCNAWIHFKCTKMTKKQINRYSRTTELYYCSACISENLPYCSMNNSKLNLLNSSDEITPDKESKYLPSGIPDNICDLCMECNPQCTGCLENTCSDPHRVCSICCNCNYVELDKFNQKCSNFKNWYKEHLSIMHVNSRSLALHLSSIKDILLRLKTPLDIFLLSETKIQNGAKLSPVQIPGYKFIPTYSTLSFGGTGIYVIHGLDHTVRDDLNFNKCDGCETTFRVI